MGVGRRTYIDGSGEAVEHTSSPFLMDAVDCRLHNRRVVVDVLHTNVHSHSTRLATSVCRSKLTKRSS